jgi:hypothetical protein
MKNLPQSEQIDLLTHEIYDCSSHRDDTLIWVSAEEESPALNQPPESFGSLSLDPQDVCGPEPMALDCPLKEQTGVLPDASYLQLANSDGRLLPPNSLEGDGCFGIQITSSPLTYRSSPRFNLMRWLLRIAALVSILLIGSVLPPILKHMRPIRVKAYATVGGPSAASQSAGRLGNRPVRVLTVMAGREETVKGISLQYLGYFDDDLLGEISRLNPNLKDFNRLEDGQLIRIPLRTLTRLVD